MAFNFSVNNTPTNCTHSMFLLKTLFAATSGWSVNGSGDGISAFSDTTDILTGFASGANGLGNDRAWFRVKAPLVDGYQREFTFQRIGNTTTHHFWRVKYSFLGNTSGGDFQTTPNATDTVVLVGTGTDALPTATNNFFATNANGTTRFHACVGDINERGMWWTANPFINNSSTALKHQALFEPLVEGSFPAADPDPNILCFWQENGSMWNAYSKVGTNTNSRSWFKLGTPQQSFTLAPGLDIVWADTIVGGLIGTNPTNNKDDLLPIIYATRTAIQANTGYKGIGKYVRYVGVNRVIGDTLSVNSTRDYIIIGHIALPWNGSVPVI